uniref:Uncharacterized protein n=1 Tax=Timema monikensis TaxID=170555 RepID=A0A7R9E9P7_9NEOP|nr:unnamed protein product [Timema monikensis]
MAACNVGDIDADEVLAIMSCDWLANQEKVSPCVRSALLRAKQKLIKQIPVITRTIVVNLILSCFPMMREWRLDPNSNSIPVCLKETDHQSGACVSTDADGGSATPSLPRRQDASVLVASRQSASSANTPHVDSYMTVSFLQQLNQYSCFNNSDPFLSSSVLPQQLITPASATLYLSFNSSVPLPHQLSTHSSTTQKLPVLSISQLSTPSLATQYPFFRKSVPPPHQLNTPTSATQYSFLSNSEFLINAVRKEIARMYREFVTARPTPARKSYYPVRSSPPVDGEVMARILAGLRITVGSEERITGGRVGRIAVGRVGRITGGRVGRIAGGRVARIAVGSVARIAEGRVGRIAVGRVARIAVGRVGRIAVGSEGRIAVDSEGRITVGRVGRIAVGIMGRIAVGRVGRIAGDSEASSADAG